MIESEQAPRSDKKQGAADDIDSEDLLDDDGLETWVEWTRRATNIAKQF